MTRQVETADGIPFSEPPQVTVSATRTHCEACQEPLDPGVMHKCKGNQEYQPPAISSTEITEACPDCKSSAVVIVKRQWFGAPGDPSSYVVVCNKCRTFVSGEVESQASAIYRWNLNARLGPSGNQDMASETPNEWPKWLAHLPGDDERANVIPSGAKPAQPDLTNYKGACPVIHVDGEECVLCGNTGEVK